MDESGVSAEVEQVPPPPLGHECCPCAERLRDRSKKLSDEWHNRIKEMLRDRDWANWWIKEAHDLLANKLGGHGPANKAVVALLLSQVDELAEELRVERANLAAVKRKDRARYRRSFSTEAEKLAEDEALIRREKSYMEGYRAALEGRKAEVRHA